MDAVTAQSVIQDRIKGHNELLYNTIDQLRNGIKFIRRFVDVRRLMIMLLVVLSALFVLYIIVHEIAYKRAITMSRCYKIRKQYTRSDAVSAKITKNDQDLLAISYDLRARIEQTACLCKSGNIMNQFSFWRYDFKTKYVKEDTVNCMCDTDYVNDPNKYTYVGDSTLVQFMNTGSVDDAKPIFKIVNSK